MYWRGGGRNGKGAREGGKWNKSARESEIEIDIVEVKKRRGRKERRESRIGGRG